MASANGAPEIRRRFEHLFYGLSDRWVFLRSHPTLGQHDLQSFTVTFDEIREREVLTLDTGVQWTPALLFCYPDCISPMCQLLPSG